MHNTDALNARTMSPIFLNDYQVAAKELPKNKYKRLNFENYLPKEESTSKLNLSKYLPSLVDTQSGISKMDDIYKPLKTDFSHLKIDLPLLKFDFNNLSGVSILKKSSNWKNYLAAGAAVLGIGGACVFGLLYKNKSDLQTEQEPLPGQPAGPLILPNLTANNGSVSLITHPQCSLTDFKPLPSFDFQTANHTNFSVAEFIQKEQLQCPANFTAKPFIQSVYFTDVDEKTKDTINDYNATNSANTTCEAPQFEANNEILPKQDEKPVIINSHNETNSTNVNYDVPQPEAKNETLQNQTVIINGRNETNNTNSTPEAPKEEVKNETMPNLNEPQVIINGRNETNSTNSSTPEASQNKVTMNYLNDAGQIAKTVGSVALTVTGEAAKGTGNIILKVGNCLLHAPGAFVSAHRQINDQFHSVAQVLGPIDRAINEMALEALSTTGNILYSGGFSTIKDVVNNGLYLPKIITVPILLVTAAIMAAHDPKIMRLLGN